MQKGALLLSLFLLTPPAMAEEVRYIFALPLKTGEIEAIAAVSNGKYLRRPVPGDKETSIRYAKDIAKGKLYTAYVSSNPVGHVTVESFDTESFCGKAKADYKATSDAVVSNGKVGKHGPALTVSPDQRAQALALALQLFKTEKVKIPADPTKMYSKFLGRDLNGDGKPEIVAYFFAPATSRTEKPHSVLLFAGVQNGKVQSQRIHCEHVDVEDVPDTTKVGPGFYTNLPFDSFDFDGDGYDEVITSKQTLSGTWYTVWHRNPKEWKDDYSTYRYREDF